MNEFWKRKRAAYLHDPPQKALDLAWHKARAEAHQFGHGLEDTNFLHSADHTAAAADRLPSPTCQHLEYCFDGYESHFRHPLGQASLKIEPFATADLATDKVWRSRPVLAGNGGAPNFDHPPNFSPTGGSGAGGLPISAVRAILDLLLCQRTRGCPSTPSGRTTVWFRLYKFALKTANAGQLSSSSSSVQCRNTSRRPGAFSTCHGRRFPGRNCLPRPWL